MSTPTVADTRPKIVPLEEGKTYFWCACGRSKTQPFCDGSHKGTEFKPLPFKAESSKPACLCCCKQSGTKPFCDGTHKKLK